MADTPLRDIALSNATYYRKVWACIVWEMGEYVKQDFAYSVLAAAIVGLLTLLDGSVTLSSLYWAAIGFGAVFVARSGQHIIYAPIELDKALRERLTASEQALAELTEHKLIFEIDIPNSKIRAEQTGNAFRLFASIRLRFENRDVHALSMKRLDLTLHHAGTEVFTVFGLLQITSNGVLINKQDFEGMMIQERRLTPFYEVELMLGVEDKDFQRASDLDVGDFLRLSMESSGYQPTFSANLRPHWKEVAETVLGTNQITVTGAPSIRRDYRRIG